MRMVWKRSEPTGARASDVSHERNRLPEAFQTRFQEPRQSRPPSKSSARVRMMPRRLQVAGIRMSSCRHECAAARFLPLESNQSGIRRNCALCESYHWMSFAKNGQSDKRVIADLDTCLRPETGRGLSRNVARAFGKAPPPHWQPVWNDPDRSAR